MDYSTSPLTSPVRTDETPFKLTLCPLGSRGGYASGKAGEHERAARDDCKGWSPGSASRFQNKLMSVDSSALPTHARALSLTFRNSPRTAPLMHGVRRAYLKRLLRRGLCLGEWHCEFQPRTKYKTGGVPHFHMAAFWDLPPPSVEELARIWLAVSREYNTDMRSQYVSPVYDLPGWLLYQGKHGSRSVHHYQRQIENVPPAWRNNTGRMWGFVAAPGYEWQFKEYGLWSSAEIFHRQRDFDQLEIIANARSQIALHTASHFTGYRNGTIPRRSYVFFKAIKNTPFKQATAVVKVKESLSNIRRGRNIKQSMPPAIQKRMEDRLSQEELTRYRSARNCYERRRALPVRSRRFKEGISRCRGVSMFSPVAADKFYASMVYHRRARIGFVKNFETEFNVMDNVALSMSKGSDCHE